MSLDLEAIKARAEAFHGYHSAEQNLAAASSARDVPALVAEVERLRESDDLLRSALSSARGVSA